MFYVKLIPKLQGYISDYPFQTIAHYVMYACADKNYWEIFFLAPDGRKQEARAKGKGANLI